MNAQKPETTDSTPSKVSLRTRISQSPITAKTTKVLAGVGVVSLAVVSYGTLAKKKSVKLEGTAPSIDVTTSDV